LKFPVTNEADKKLARSDNFRVINVGRQHDGKAVILDKCSV